MAKANPVETVVSVTTAAVKLSSAAANRLSVTFTNNGASTLYLKSTSDVSSANAAIIVPSGSYHYDNESAADWWGVTSAATADTRVLEYRG